MTIVSNTTPLIGMAVIQRFDLLRQLFGEIQIPQAVHLGAQGNNDRSKAV